MQIDVIYVGKHDTRYDLFIYLFIYLQYLKVLLRFGVQSSPRGQEPLNDI